MKSKMLELHNGDLSCKIEFVVFNGVKYKAPVDLWSLIVGETIIDLLKDKSKNDKNR